MTVNFWVIVVLCTLVWNLLTFAVCRYDKRAASYNEGKPLYRRQPRVAEKWFFIFALLGGWLGIWVGVYKRPRHKTSSRKCPFRLLLGLATVGNWLGCWVLIRKVAFVRSV